MPPTSPLDAIQLNIAWAGEHAVRHLDWWRFELNARRFAEPHQTSNWARRPMTQRQERYAAWMWSC